MTLDKETFIIYVAYLRAKISIYLVQKAQQVLLLVKKISIFKEYTDFLDVISKKTVVVLSERLVINKYTINLKLGKQQFYRPIYSLGLVELETFKTSIKINLANGFIRPSNFLVRALIFFSKSLTKVFVCM